MRKIVLLLLFASLLFSCTREKEEMQISYGIFTTKAVFCNDTKTDLTGSSIRFGDNESMALVCEGLNRFTINNSNSENSTVFQGVYRVTGKSGTNCDWYSVYPETLGVSDMGVISGTLPAEQIAPFDPNANMMYSDIIIADYDEESQPAISLGMNQMMGLIRISFTNSNALYEQDILQSVQLRSSVPLSGDFSMDIHSGSLRFEGSTRKYVTSLYTISEVLGVDQQHWITLFINPVQLSGAKLIIRTDKHTFTYTSKKIITPSAGAMTLLPLMDLDDFVEDGPTRLKKRVACWGDSLTDASDTKSYTRFLQELLGEEWEVFNGGNSGNRTYEIAARQGGLPLVTGAAFTLPSGTGTIVVDGVKRTHNVMGDAGYFDIRYLRGKLQNPCMLIGTKGEEILCNISSSRSINGNDTTYTAQVSRLTPGNPVEIAEHSPIQTYAARELRDVDLTIIYMGTNGSFGSDDDIARYNYSRLDNLIDQHREMINFTAHPESYLVLGIHWTPDWQNNYGYEDMFESEFSESGARFLNLRLPVVNDVESCKYWIMYSGAVQSESDIPQSDLDRAKLGRWPKILMVDSMHPNDYGQRVFAKLIYDRMVELGYLD